jgi:ribose transport system substrate-binding protein
MKAHRLLVAVAAAAALTGLAACGDAEEESGGDAAAVSATAIKPSKSVGTTKGPNGEAPTPSSELTLTQEEIDEVKAGDHTAALVWHQSADFTTAVTAGAKDEFAKLGIDVVATTDAGFDAGRQKSDIETVMAKRPSAILSLPADPVVTASAYRDAVAAGTELVLLSNVPQGLEHGKDYVSVVTDDLFQMGQQAADALAAAIGGKGKIGYFFHDADYYVTNQRDQAFKATIEANYPDIEIAAEQGIADPNKAEEQANAMLTQNPDLDGIYATWSSPVGDSVLSALRNNGNTKTKLVSLDLDEPLALDLARGGNVTALVTDEAYELGRTMATAAAYGLLGKEAPPFVVVPATTVTQDGIEEGYQTSLHRAPPQSVLDAAE